MKKMILLGLVTFLAVFSFTLNVEAARLLVSDSGGEFGYGYGYSQWVNMTGTLNTAFGGAGNVDVAPNFENLGLMSTYDALWLDQRGTSGVLSPTEVSNIAAFIATGRPVVMMGENSNWWMWNNQILGIVGGTYNFGEYDGLAYPIVNHCVTCGVNSVNLAFAGVAEGGQALFDQNFATLWGANVLTILDVNVMDDVYWSNVDNAIFSENVAKWVAGGCYPVPIPAAVWLLGSGLLGLIGLRKKFQN